MSDAPPLPALHARPAPAVLDVPVVLFAFNRPDYLDRVCASLLRQRGAALDPRRVFLLQDGAVSPRSGLRYAEDSQVEASIAAFRRHFPRGHVAAAPHNLGIAANIRRGEVLAFEALGADLAYFFEDDLELGPDYLRMMGELRALSERDARIGYFAAYGDHHIAPTGPYVWLVRMQHNWGFGLKRDAWRRLCEFLVPYDRILDGADYAYRDHLAIFRWMETLPVSRPFSSQDTAKTLGCDALGIARVMTEVCFARYIGEKGSSFDEGVFREMGFEGAGWREGPEHHLAEGVEGAVSRIMAESLAMQTEHRQKRLARLLQEKGAVWMDRNRPATPEDVAFLFRMLLDRVPESEVGTGLVGRPLHEARTALLTSREFRGRNPVPLGD
ncbi:hypothetical protein [Roseomonas indoligenes]|uniref:hypothetical protein n=1 Tax=Roseomonas indoligenes TaxID=2820811 RepID=UPI001FD74FDE|nr:hypothetical protein [Pararoseomonas indoligenes]